MCDGLVSPCAVRVCEAQVPVCVYGTLRPGQPGHERVFGDGDVAAVFGAVIPWRRLVVSDEDAGGGRWGGYAMAVAAPGGDGVVGELLVLHPGRVERVLAAVDDYEFEQVAAGEPGCPYRRTQVGVHLPIGTGTRWPAFTVSAWVYLPAGPLLGHVEAARAVPGDDWTRVRPVVVPDGAPWAVDHAATAGCALAGGMSVSQDGRPLSWVVTDGARS